MNGRDDDWGELSDLADMEEEEARAQEAAWHEQLLAEQRMREEEANNVNRELRELQAEWASDPRAQEEYRRWQIETLTKDEAMTGIIASAGSGTSFKQASPGNHVARLYQIIDIGTQHGEYKGEATANRQVIFRWELPFETATFDGVEKPLIVSKWYTLSLGEKANLRKDLEAWLARPLTLSEMKGGLDIVDLLGMACMVSVNHNDQGKARVVGLGAMPKGMVCPKAFNPVSYFSLDNFKQEEFDALPEGFRKQIMRSDEYIAMKGAPLGGRQLDMSAQQRPAPAKLVVPDRQIEVDDDIPF